MTPFDLTPFDLPELRRYIFDLASHDHEEWTVVEGVGTLYSRVWNLCRRDRETLTDWLRLHTREPAEMEVVVWFALPVDRERSEGLAKPRLTFCPRRKALRFELFYGDTLIVGKNVKTCAKRPDPVEIEDALGLFHVCCTVTYRAIRKTRRRPNPCTTIDLLNLFRHTNAAED